MSIRRTLLLSVALLATWVGLSSLPEPAEAPRSSFRYASGVCRANQECPECNNLTCQWSAQGQHRVCYQYNEGCASWGECPYTQ
jgi:hypothetical protein